MNTQCEHTAVVVCIALRRGRAQTQRRLVAVSLNIGDNNTARPGADPPIVPLWPGNTTQVRQAWVQYGFKNREPPLLSTQTHASLLSNFSAQGTAVVRAIILRTYIRHRTTLGLTCCRQCSRGTPNSGGTISASNIVRQQQRQRQQRHTRG